MAVLDDFLNGAKNIVDVAEDKATKAFELSKTKYKSAQLSKELSDLYKSLGSAVYSMMKSEYEDKELIDSLVSEIDIIKDELDEINSKLARRKNKKICPACDTANEKDSAYCTRCGNRFDSEE